ncbi:MAG: hypothetical protein HUU15_09815 [Candidatus Brocadiae bacterium]|nr:hypothetical protein [Candidatus Brocadiia bacterium]
MIARGGVLYAVLREEASLDTVDVLACGVSESHLASRLEDFRRTTTGKTRRLVRVKLVIEELLDDVQEQPVRT